MVLVILFNGTEYMSVNGWAVAYDFVTAEENGAHHSPGMYCWRVCIMDTAYREWPDNNSSCDLHVSSGDTR